MQALIDFDGWRKWKDFSNSNVNTSPHKDHNEPPTIKTKATSQSSGPKDATSPRSTAMNGQLPGGPKSKRTQLMQPSLDGIGEEGRERSISDETDNTTDSNAEDSGSKVVAVGA